MIKPCAAITFIFASEINLRAILIVFILLHAFNLLFLPLLAMLNGGMFCCYEVDYHFAILIIFTIMRIV